MYPSGLVRSRPNDTLVCRRAALLSHVLVGTSASSLADRADHFITSWTIHYDTIYASPDKKYDEKIGVHSTARLFGSYIRSILSIFCVGFVTSLAYAGYVNHQGPIYYIADVAFTAVVLLWQLVMTKDFEKDGSSLYRVCVIFSARLRNAHCKFSLQANGLIGYATVIGLLADYVYKVLL